MMCLSRCHAVDCDEVGHNRTLIGVWFCDAHMSKFYADDDCEPWIEGQPGDRLAVSGVSVARFVWRTATLRNDVVRRSIRRKIDWVRWRPRHWYRWRVKSWIGRTTGLLKCQRCDRFNVKRVGEDARVWCDGCRRDQDRASYTCGDIGKRECLDCGAAADTLLLGKAYCRAHGHLRYFGEPYEPPSDEQISAFRAWAEAMVELDSEGQGPPTRRSGNITMSTMDGPYLERLAEKVKGKLGE